MEERFCELCGSSSQLTVTIGTPLGIVRGDVCFGCFGNGERDDELAIELVEKRFIKAQELWKLEHPITEEHPVPKEIAGEVFQYVLGGQNGYSV